MKSVIPKFIISYSFFVWGVTEGLSLCHALTVPAMRLIYGLLFIVLVSWLWTRRKEWKERIKQIIAYLGTSKLLIRKQYFGILLVVLAIFIAGWTFLLSITIVPNNWDSMTYHLARVANWIQNASVEYYPTNIPRQLYYSAFTEYFVLHICLLLKNDQFVNIVQWVGYTVSAVMVYRITRELNVCKTVAVFSSLLFMMCPLAIAESMTTQTDLMSCMWVLISAYFILLLGKSSNPLWQKNNIILLFFSASSIGFVYLTKASACFMLLPFLLWLLIVCLQKREKWSCILKSALMALGIILLLLAPGFTRNYESTGDIFAFKQVAGNLMIKTVNPKLLFLNFCKNLTIEMASKEEVDLVWRGTMMLADYMEVDIEDPEISAYEGFEWGYNCTKSYHHDTAGAHMLIVIAIIATLLFLLRSVYIFWKKRGLGREKLIISYLFIAVCASAMMFICIRWQPWGNRLLLPTLPVFCILIGYAINDFTANTSLRVIMMGAALFLMCPDAYKTMEKQMDDYANPVWQGEERFDLYFRNWDGVNEIYRAIIKEVESKNVSDIGLLLSGNTYEYPLWVALKSEDTEIHHVVLDDTESVWMPDCIIAINRGIEPDQHLMYGMQEYYCVWNFDGNSDFSILMPYKHK